MTVILLIYFHTFQRREVLDVNVGMRGSNISHVYSIQHYRDHVVGKDFPELFCYVILAERILQGQVELQQDDVLY